MTRPASHTSILHGAETVFARQGLADTSVADLLSAAGVSRRTFYKSFDNKEAVLAALYTERTDILMRALEQARSSCDPMTVLMSGLDVYLDYHATAGPLLRLFIEEAGRSGSLLAERRVQFRAALLAFINEAAGVEVDPWLFHAMLAAMEGISLQLLASDVSKAELRRAKKVARLIVERAFLPELNLTKAT
jgi:AcrR family transcriptional regulator